MQSVTFSPSYIHYLLHGALPEEEVPFMIVEPTVPWDLSNVEDRVEAAIAIESLRTYLQAMGTAEYRAAGAVFGDNSSSEQDVSNRHGPAIESDASE